MEIKEIPKEVVEKAQIIDNVFDILKERNEILMLINELVSSDCAELDIIQGRKVTKREKILADLVSKIYKIVHPLFSTCKHDNWEEETKKLLKTFNHYKE